MDKLTAFVFFVPFNFNNYQVCDYVSHPVAEETCCDVEGDRRIVPTHTGTRKNWLHFRFFDVERTFPRVSRTQQNILNINEYIWEVYI